MLQMVHQQTTQLVEDLKNYELPSIIPRSPMDADDFGKSITGSAAAGASSAVSVSAMLDTAMEELFVPYTESQRYLERESKSLSELYASFLTNFTRYHVSRPPLRDIYRRSLTGIRRNARTKAGSHPSSTAW